MGTKGQAARLIQGVLNQTPKRFIAQALASSGVEAGAGAAGAAGALTYGIARVAGSMAGDDPVELGTAVVTGRNVGDPSPGVLLSTDPLGAGTCAKFKFDGQVHDIDNATRMLN